MRCRQTIKAGVWTLVYAGITIFLSVILAIWWNAWRVKCIRVLNKWLLVHNVLMFIHALVHFAYCFIWIWAKDPTIWLTRFRVFFHFWVYLFEAGWIIYGSTFIYSEEIKECGEKYDVVIGLREEEKHSVSTLRLTVLVYICLGYLLWLIILCSLCFVICAYQKY